MPVVGTQPNAHTEHRTRDDHAPPHDTPSSRGFPRSHLLERRIPTALRPSIILPSTEVSLVCLGCDARTKLSPSGCAHGSAIRRLRYQWENRRENRPDPGSAACRLAGRVRRRVGTHRLGAAQLAIVMMQARHGTVATVEPYADGGTVLAPRLCWITPVKRSASAGGAHEEFAPVFERHVPPVGSSRAVLTLIAIHDDDHAGKDQVPFQPPAQ